MEVLNTLDSVGFYIHGAWFVAGTEPNFPLNAPQPNLPGHVVAICRFDTSHCIDISYCSGIGKVALLLFFG